MTQRKRSVEAFSPLPKLAFSIQEFGQVFGIGPSTIYELIKDGKLAPAKIRNKTVFTKIEVERFAASLASSEGEVAR